MGGFFSRRTGNISLPNDNNKIITEVEDLNESDKYEEKVTQDQYGGYTFEETAQYYYEQGFYAAHANQIAVTTSLNENESYSANTETLRKTQSDEPIDLEDKIKKEDKNIVKDINIVKNVDFGEVKVIDYNQNEVIRPDLTVKLKEERIVSSNIKTSDLKLSAAEQILSQLDRSKLVSYLKNESNDTDNHNDTKTIDDDTSETIFFHKRNQRKPTKFHEANLKNEVSLKMEEIEMD